jgi:hypothetical protein
MAGSEQVSLQQSLATGIQTGSPGIVGDAGACLRRRAHNRFAITGNDAVSVVRLTSTSDPPANDLHLATTFGNSPSP